jgi:beta-lactamase class A
MSEHLGHSCDNRDQQIAQLKAELERAYGIISQLERGKTQPQDQLVRTLQYSDGGIDTAVSKRVVDLPFEKNPDLGLKNGSPHPPIKKVKRRRSKLKASVKQLFQLLVLSMISAVAFGLILYVGRGLTRLKPPKPVIVPTPTTFVSPTPEQTLKLPPSHSPKRPTWAIAQSLPVPSRQSGQDISEITYNLQTPPHFTPNQHLQTIVNEVVALASANRFPKQSLSITLIDPSTGETAGYQPQKLKYPASVVKIFWMVALYAQIQKGWWVSGQAFNPYIAKMIEESNNEAASFILDEITGTESVPTLKGKELREWINKRLQVSRFFQQAGYKDIIVSQKTFPISYLRANEPRSNDLRIQQILKQPAKPFRNLITTEHAARLMYEICYTGQAVSQEASKKMCGWLKRDLNPAVWNRPAKEYMDFNPVRGFFGESLANTDAQLYSKAGWTSRTRYEVAFVVTPDNQKSYILAIVGSDRAYARDERIFPKMSHLVYSRMTSSSVATHQSATYKISSH